jgi:hypothetical protein
MSLKNKHSAWITGIMYQNIIWATLPTQSKLPLSTVLTNHFQRDTVDGGLRANEETKLSGGKNQGKLLLSIKYLKNQRLKNLSCLNYIKLLRTK